MQATGELVAGRELDALVAERVMGETVYPDYGASNMHGVTPYSTDIAAAWQVLTELASRGLSLDVQYRVFTGEWTVVTGLSYQSAETAPLAICRAALRAVSQAE